MYAVLPGRQRKRHHRVDEIRVLPLEPSEFCRRWVNMPPDERGYYKACVKALAQATGLSARTVEGWGKDFAKRPDYVLNILRKEDIINQIRQLVLPPDAIKD
jgi:hypothetical protein